MKYLSFANRIVRDVLFEILIVIIDLSGSMNTKDWKPSRKAGAVKANRELIKVKFERYPQDRIGIIGFGSYARVLHDPIEVSRGAESLQKALADLPTMGGTDFGEALDLAESCLFEESRPAAWSPSYKKATGFLSRLLYDPPVRRSDAIAERSAENQGLKRIIMLSDGDYNEGGSPLKKARRLRDAGVVIDCVGIASREDVKDETLKQIASRNPDGSIRYCFIGDQQDLIRKYETLAHHIRPV
ncbi:MAG: vWA domain-containing protein [Planctomycetota bacterium]|jgi:Mg-chelatase subunit ChlD